MSESDAAAGGEVVMPEPPASTSEQHHAGAELDPDAEVYAKPEESAGGSSEAFMKRTNIAAAVFEAEVGRQIEARTRLGHERYQDKVWFCLGRESQPRKFCINVNNDSRFHTAVVVLILISSVYMVTDNPVQRRAAVELDLTPADVGLSISTCGPFDPDGNRVSWKMLNDYVARTRGFEMYWEMFFIVCFTLEMLIKLVALGVQRYYGDAWNWLDFVVVFNGIISQILTATGTGGTGAVSVLRLFRMLRPLRALKRVRGMRVLVDTIIGSLPQICRVFMVLVLCCFILGIVGVQLFSSNLRHQCWAPTSDGGWTETGYRCRPLCFDAINFETQAFKPGKNNSDCLSLGETTLRRGMDFKGDGLGFWTCAEHSQEQCLCGGNPVADAFCSFTDNPNFGANGFDNILQAMATVFQTITMEGWVDTLYDLSDGADRYWAIAFQYLAVVLGSFVIVNLFLAVLTDGFDAAEKDAVKDDTEETKPNVELVMKEKMSNLRHAGKTRQWCLEMARSPRFEYAMISFIVINTLSMCLEYFPPYPEQFTGEGDWWFEPSPPLNSSFFDATSSRTTHKPGPYFWTLWILNAVLTLVFNVESVIKLIGLGPKIFAMDNFNLFDVTIVVISDVELGMAILGFLGMALPDFGFSALRSFRALRILKLVRGAKPLRKYFASLLKSLASVSYLLLLLVMILSIFALLGMEFFGGFTPVRVDWGNWHVNGSAGGASSNPLLHYSAETLPCSFKLHGIEWGADEEIGPYSFDSFAMSFVSIFVVLSGENWNDTFFMQHRATFSYYWDNARLPVAWMYFVTLYVLGNLLLFNMFIAILITKMDDDDEDKGPSSPSRLSGGSANNGSVLLQYEFGGYLKRESTGDASPEPRRVTLAERLTSRIEHLGGMYHAPLVIETPAELKKRHSKRLLEEEAAQSLDRSLCLFSYAGPIRKTCIEIIHHKAFANTVLVLILVSSLQLGLDWQGYPASHPITTVFLVADIFFAIIFTFEMAVKVIANGFLFSSNSKLPAYLRSGWNVLDFIVVLVSWITILAALIPAMQFLGFIKMLRVLRALRPLRLIARLESMRIVVATLFSSMPAVSWFFLFFSIFLLIFSILFINLFGGRLGYCLDPLYADEHYGSRVIPGSSAQYDNDYEECMALPKYNLTRHDSLGRLLTDWDEVAGELLPTGDWVNRTSVPLSEAWGPSYRKSAKFVTFPQWVNPDFGHFDHIFSAVLLLLEVALLEGWPDVLFWVWDSDLETEYIQPWWLPDYNDVGLQRAGSRHRTNQVFAPILFVLWIVLGAFILLNMTIGIVLDAFNRGKAENEGLSLLTDEQTEWVRAQKSIIATRPLKKRSPPEQRWRMPFFNIVTSDGFDASIMAVIVLNTCFMAVSTWSPEDPTWSPVALFHTLRIINICFSLVYLTEMLLKWMGLGLKQYYKDPWNTFDCILVVVSVFDIISSEVARAADSASVIPFPPALLRVLRLFRVVRILRILRTAKNLRAIISTIRISIPQLRNISILLILLLYIFAVIFHSLFWKINYTPGSMGLEQFPGSPEIPHQTWVNVTREDYFYTNGNSNDGDFVNRHANFRNLGYSFNTLIRCITGESFNGIMHDLMDEEWGSNRLRCCPTCGPVTLHPLTGEPVADSSCGPYSGFMSIFFMMSFAVAMTFLILNGLFIGVIVENFTNIGSEHKDITIEAIEEFREIWLRWDPEGTFTIPSHSLFAVLQSLSKPLGKMNLGHNGYVEGTSRAELLNWMAELDIPDHDGVVHFMEVLTALSYHVSGTPLPLNETTKRISRSVEELVKKKRLVRSGSAANGLFHDVATNYIAERLQQRWRGHMGRLKDEGVAISTKPHAQSANSNVNSLHACDGPRGRVGTSAPATDSDEGPVDVAVSEAKMNPHAAIGRIKGNQVAPLP
mmetsp:Transcript_19340/g.63041  ORF Transcript_19340/g.63041 Transcript_19340/m.63041 type:complete len:1899 (-) Transcript_19340:223-5919(-)